MRMRRVHRLLLPILLLLGAGRTPAAAAEGFVVVVNAANPVATLPAEEVSRYFLHKTLQWPNGTRVAAVDLVEDSPARDAFSRSSAKLPGLPVCRCSAMHVLLVEYCDGRTRLV